MDNKEYLKKILSANIHVQDKQKLDDSLNKITLPDFNNLPYQTLVTDKNGEIKWEERTHYAKKTTVEWDGDRTGLTSVGSNITRYCKISNEIPTYEELMADNATYTVCKNITAVPEKKWIYENGKAYGRFGYNTTTTAPMIVAICETPVNIGNIPFSEKGLYFANFFNSKYYFTSFTWGEDKILSENYIPSTVPVIQSASINQAIVVKTVDENSKPIEWETSNIVKSVNKSIPDEDGNITTIEPYTFVWTNLMGDLINTYSVEEILKRNTDTAAFNRSDYLLRFQNSINVSEPIQEYMCIKIESPLDGQGVYRFYFGDEIPSILVDNVNNTVALDPDWVKPEVPITESRVNELIASALETIPNAEEVSF